MQLAEIEAGLPAGYRFVWGGQFENQQRAMKRLVVVVPVALLLIFVMLISALRSARSASLIMVNLPFAVIGGVAAMHLLGAASQQCIFSGSTSASRRPSDSLPYWAWPWRMDWCSSVSATSSGPEA
ncbi:MAG: efflux RND transporter permease subunit [Planctomycetota bacterium]